MANPVADVRGKSVLVIAGTRGIGRAISTRFAEAGAVVTFTARSEAVAEKVAAELRERFGDRVNSAVLDVTDADLEEKLEQVFRQGVPDAVVYNAGICPSYTRPEKMSLELWDLVHDTNLRGAIRVSLAYARACQASQRKGNIVLISSMTGVMAGRKLAPYVTAKTGMLGLTRALAMDWADVGIRVNAVAPGWVDTDLTSGLQGNETINNKLVSDIPLGYFAKPEEIVDVVVFLASESARYVTGSVYSVDGGLLAGK